MSQFGESVRTARHRAGLSQEQLANATGLHRTHISLVERGLREPRLDTLVKLARALDVPPTIALEWWVVGRPTP